MIDSRYGRSLGSTQSLGVLIPGHKRPVFFFRVIGRLDLSVPPSNLLVELGDTPGELVNGTADHHPTTLQPVSHLRGRIGGLTHTLGRIPMDQRPGTVMCRSHIAAEVMKLGGPGNHRFGMTGECRAIGCARRKPSVTVAHNRSRWSGSPRQ